METETTFVRKKLAEQVAESLRESIRHNRLSENSRLPSSRVLARQYGISHNVMLKALQQLHNDGLIFLRSTREGYHVCK